LPKAFDGMVLLPNVPDLRPAQRLSAQVHQIIAPRGTFPEKEEHDGAKRGIGSAHTARRDVNTPRGRVEAQDFFPRRGLLFAMVDRTRIVACAGNDDGLKTQGVPLLSEWRRHEPGISGEGELGDGDSMAPKRLFEWGEHGQELTGLIGIPTPLFRAKQEMDRQGDLMEGEHHAEPILALYHVFASTCLHRPLYQLQVQRRNVPSRSITR